MTPYEIVSIEWGATYAYVKMRDVNTGEVRYADVPVGKLWDMVTKDN